MSIRDRIIAWEQKQRKKKVSIAEPVFVGVSYIISTVLFPLSSTIPVIWMGLLIGSVIRYKTNPKKYNAKDFWKTLGKLTLSAFVAVIAVFFFWVIIDSTSPNTDNTFPEHLLDNALSQCANWCDQQYTYTNSYKVLANNGTLWCYCMDTPTPTSPEDYTAWNISLWYPQYFN